jgi:benzoyl-CoA reductase/2-hydroxyglutaryl-CoA dehydratase subunit BcrC/BadD/HgdB
MSASAIEELRAGFVEPFLTLGTAGARTTDTVVISWPSVPTEIVHAAGFAPVVARSHAAPTPAADRALEPDLFPGRLRQLVEAALTGRLTGVAAVVLPRTSDADYKCYLYLRELVRRGLVAALPPLLLFDLLHSDGSAAQAYDADRTREWAQRLASLAGRQFAPDDVRAAIAKANRGRTAARRLDALRSPLPRVAGSDALPLTGALWQLEPERYALLATAAADELAGGPALAGSRVLLAGAPVDSTALHVAVEAEGGVVVAELSPFGTCGARVAVDTTADPFAALAEHYRCESIDARLPVAALMRKLEGALEHVDAVILSLPPDDASFGFDYPRVRELLASRGIAHTVVGGDLAVGATAADRERIRTMLRTVAPPEARHG